MMAATGVGQLAPRVHGGPTVMGTLGIGNKWVAFVMRIGSDTLLELQASDRELMTLMAQQLARGYLLDQGFASLEQTIGSVVLMKQQLAAAGKSANAGSSAGGGNAGGSGGNSGATGAKVKAAGRALPRKGRTACYQFNSAVGCTLASCPCGHFCTRCIARNKGKEPHTAHGCTRV
ncbi:hypothetical protein T492DRAFT_1025188 [Pavlovales sp. CCMP2436]|nr:hypothetical protein T492DRAFT_1025188 [Pavlovales sp. CCMP2436]